MIISWIKTRDDLEDDPAVLAIARRLESTVLSYVIPGEAGDLVKHLPTLSRNVLRDITVAACQRLWRHVCRHGSGSIPSESNAKSNALRSVTGNVTGNASVTGEGVTEVTPTADAWIIGDLASIDLITGIPGFGAAMKVVGWVAEEDKVEALRFPNFQRFNRLRRQPKSSATAPSARSSNAARQARWRANHPEKSNALRNAVTPPLLSADKDKDIINDDDNAGGSPAPISLELAKTQRADIAPEIVAAWWHSRQRLDWTLEIHGKRYRLTADNWTHDLDAFAAEWTRRTAEKAKRPARTPSTTPTITTAKKGAF